MLERYQKAHENNLKYIKDLITHDPEAIDLTWDGDYTESDRMQVAAKSSKEGALLGGGYIAALLLFPQVTLPIVILGQTIGLIGLYTHNHTTSLTRPKRIGWTLLEFAADGNATDVAVYLICNGAGIDNNFLEIARKNRHPDFVTVCENMIEARANRLRIENIYNKALLQKEAQSIKQNLKLISKRNTLRKLREDYLQITHENKMYKDEIDECDNDDAAQYGADQAPIDRVELEKNLGAMKAVLASEGEILEIMLASQNEITNESSKAMLLGYNEGVAHATKLYEKIHMEYLLRAEEYYNAHKAYVEKSNQLRELIRNKKVASPCAADLAPKPEIKKSSTGPRFFPAAQPTPSKPDKFQYPFGFRDKDIPFRTGDCFYDVVIHNRPDKQWNRRELRQAVKQEMLREKDMYNLMEQDNKSVLNEIIIWVDGKKDILFEEFDNYESYVDSMAKEQVCVDNIQIAAFVNTKKLCCIIIPNQGEDGFHDHNIYGRDHLSDTNPPIFLGHQMEGRCHYVALELPKDKNWKEKLAELDDHVNKIKKSKVNSFKK